MGALLAPFTDSFQLAMLLRTPGWAAASFPGAAKAAGAKDGSGLGQEKTRWLPSPFSFRSSFTRFFFFKRQTTCREIRISRGKGRALIGPRNTSASPPTGFDTFCTARSKTGGSALKGEARRGPSAARGSNGPPPSLPPARRGEWAEPGKY